jgi:hypothetical protein
MLGVLLLLLACASPTPVPPADRGRLLRLLDAPFAEGPLEPLFGEDLPQPGYRVRPVSLSLRQHRRGERRAPADGRCRKRLGKPGRTALQKLHARKGKLRVRPGAQLGINGIARDQDRTKQASPAPRDIGAHQPVLRR